jgi:hypothetical protein
MCGPVAVASLLHDTVPPVGYRVCIVIKKDLYLNLSPVHTNRLAFITPPTRTTGS